MSDTPVQAEATTTDGTVEFKHFGRTWHVPATLRFSHRERLAAELARLGDGNAAMCTTYLSAAELHEFREIDPSEAEIDKFTDDMAVALGFKSAGN